MGKGRIQRSALAATLLCSVASASAAPTVPVRIGLAHPDLDACPILTVVVAYAPGSDVIVLRGPGEQYGPAGLLAAGERAWICGSSAGGEWLAIVHMPDDADNDCGLTIALAAPRDYAGPCLSGWLPAQRLLDIAG